MLSSVYLGSGVPLESATSFCYLDDQSWSGDLGNHDCLDGRYSLGGLQAAVILEEICVKTVLQLQKEFLEFLENALSTSELSSYPCKKAGNSTFCREKRILLLFFK